MSAARAPGSAAECRRHAIEVIDRLSAKRDPEAVPQALAEAMTCIVRYRDALIAESRSRAESVQPQQLGRANAVVSLIFGTQFPLEGVHWDRLAKAREALAEL